MKILVFSLFLCSFLVTAVQAKYKASFTQNDYEYDVSETSKFAEIKVVLDRPVEGFFATVNVADIQGGAVPGKHYRHRMTKIIIPQGETQGTVVVELKAVPGESRNKDFALQIVPDDSIDLGARSATKVKLKYSKDIFITIRSEGEILEGPKSAITTSQFTVTLSDKAVDIIDLAVVNVRGTASSSDFTLSNFNVVFRPGETVKTISVNIIGDNDPEDDESIILDFEVMGTGSDNVRLITKESTLTISDDDIVELVIENQSINEDDRTLEYVVSLSQELTEPVSAFVSFRGMSATKGADYDGPEQVNFVFNPGETKKIITLSIIDDELAEGDETFEAKVSTDNVRIEVKNETATITIVDDEGASFEYETKIIITDPDSGPMFLNGDVKGEVEKVSERKFVVLPMQGLVSASPDPLGLTGIFRLSVISIEFEDNWDLKNLIFNFSDFPASPIPGPHLFMQMLIAFHSMNGDLFFELRPNEYQWRPSNSKVLIASNTEKSIILTLDYLFTDTGYEQETSVKLTIKK